MLLLKFVCHMALKVTWPRKCKFAVISETVRDRAKQSEIFTLFRLLHAMLKKNRSLFSDRLIYNISTISPFHLCRVTVYKITNLKVIHNYVKSFIWGYAMHQYFIIDMLQFSYAWLKLTMTVDLIAQLNLTPKCMTSRTWPYLYVNILQWQYTTQ